MFACWLDLRHDTNHAWYSIEILRGISKDYADLCAGTACLLENLAVFMQSQKLYLDYYSTLFTWIRAIENTVIIVRHQRICCYLLLLSWVPPSIWVINSHYLDPVLSLSQCTRRISIMPHFIVVTTQGYVMILTKGSMSVAKVTAPVRARGVKSRMCPPYPSVIVKGD